MTRVDVNTIRTTHPIEDVIANSGVALRPQGHGYMGCCPFHDDSTASMSVGGVPGRFKCFGCGVGGDVIDYVRLLHHTSFIQAATMLQRTNAAAELPEVHAHLAARPIVRDWATPPGRLFDVNQLAWQHYTSPGRMFAAESYLANVRHINVALLRADNEHDPVVGYANTRSSLTDDLLGQGVTETELLDADLAQRSRTGHLVDTYRERVMFPIRRPNGLIEGFIGRDTTGNTNVPKYRNPTRTPIFDKSTALYRPTLHHLHPGATVVVVEGVIDAIAIATAAAQIGRTAMYAPCTTSGTAVSAAQARQVLNLCDNPPVIALDGDTAGAQGTLRWLSAITNDQSRDAHVTRLPNGFDPADWIASGHNPDVFQRPGYIDPDAEGPQPRPLGRELVQFWQDRRTRQTAPVPAGGAGISPCP